MHLLENVAQRGWDLYSRIYRERETVGLSGAVIGVLPDDDDFRLVERRCVERRENASCRRIYPYGGVGVLGFVEFRGEGFLPSLLDLDVHRVSRFYRCAERIPGRKRRQRDIMMQK